MKVLPKEKIGAKRVKIRGAGRERKCETLRFLHGFLVSERPRKFSRSPNDMFWVSKNKFQRSSVSSKKKSGHWTRSFENIAERKKSGTKKKVPCTPL